MASQPARTACAQRSRRTQVAMPATSDVTASSFTFSADDFRSEADIERLMNTFVDRASDDRRQIYREIILVTPPSPIKNARQAAVQSSSFSRVEAWSTVPNVDDKHYEMFYEPEDETPLALPRTRTGTKRTLFSVRRTSLI
jgi:hypothetical protein